MLDLFNKLINIIFPPCCGMCNKLSDSYLCDNCKNHLNLIQQNKTIEYKDKFINSHFYIFKYEDEIRDKIIDYKFNNKSYLYRTFLEVILNNKETLDYIKSFDIIIPVPIHKKRYKERGYNQSELITKEIAQNVDNIEFRNNIIAKIKNIVPQSELTKEKRYENVKDVYKLCKNIDLEGKKILLFDDVFTTGSTINECAKILLKTGCKEVGALTIAKDILF